MSRPAGRSHQSRCREFEAKLDLHESGPRDELLTSAHHDQPMRRPADTGELAGAQAELDAHQAAMRQCTACVDAGFILESHPVFRGTAAQRIMVVGQAPAIRRTEHPGPYSGVSGKVLDRWLERAGFPPGSLRERCYLTSLTKCFPGPSQSGKGDRPPSTTEIALCRPNLERELALVRPEVILPLGKLSSAHFVRNQPLHELVGNVYVRESTVVIPLPHPSGVSRWLNDPPNRALLDRALDALNAVRQEHRL
jgi:uracil-DNA glycosylase family 4